MQFTTITDFVAIVLTLFSSGLAFLMFLSRLKVGEQKPNRLYLQLSMLFISVWTLADGVRYLFESGISPSYPLPLSIVASVTYFYTGPLLYVYINSQVSGRENTPTGIVPHLVFPTTISLFFLTLFPVHVFFSLEMNTVNTIDKTLTILATVVSCLYALSLTAKMVLLLYRSRNIISRHFIIHGALLLLLLATMLFYLAGSRFLLSIFFFLVMAMFFVFGDIFSTDLLILRDEAGWGEQERSHIGHLNVDEILEHMISLLSGKKIYRDRDLSLKSFAEKLDLSPRQVSEIMKSRMGMNFTACIDYYRIDEAREILKNNSDISMALVAHDLGFSSLSSFYAAFKKITGMSPGSFLKSVNT